MLCYRMHWNSLFHKCNKNRSSGDSFCLFYLHFAKVVLKKKNNNRKNNDERKKKRNPWLLFNNYFRMWLKHAWNLITFDPHFALLLTFTLMMRIVFRVFDEFVRLLTMMCSIVCLFFDGHYIWLMPMFRLLCKHISI